MKINIECSFEKDGKKVLVGVVNGVEKENNSSVGRAWTKLKREAEKLGYNCTDCGYLNFKYVLNEK